MNLAEGAVLYVCVSLLVLLGLCLSVSLVTWPLGLALYSITQNGLQNAAGRSSQSRGDNAQLSSVGKVSSTGERNDIS